MKVEVGKICYKGNHTSYYGEADHGACSGHYWATIYLTVEEDRTNPRGEAVDPEYLKEQFTSMVRDAEETRERRMWESEGS